MDINLISGYMVENSTVGIDSIRIERHLAEIGGRKQPGRIRHDHVLDSLCENDDELQASRPHLRRLPSISEALAIDEQERSERKWGWRMGEKA